MPGKTGASGTCLAPPIPNGRVNPIVAKSPTVQRGAFSTILLTDYGPYVVRRLTQGRPHY
jgi:hypothetical protein